ncbi:MAG: LPS export ABC transporter periplasmic protein LptC [Bacteriovoracaceae bacterium]|nr:LPS export ABC transporter periplasmic protein LptC [Bacteriovoracaceae bacterium]
MLYEIWHYVLIFAFVSTCSGVIYYSWEIDNSNFAEQKSKVSSEFEPSQKSYFNNVVYYTQQTGKALYKFSASKLINDGAVQTITYFNPNGTIFLTNQLPVHYSAKRGFHNKLTSKIKMDEDVTIKRTDMILQSKQVVFEMQKEKITATGQVKTKFYSRFNMDRLFIDAQKVVYWPSKNEVDYSFDVNGVVKRHKIYEQSMNFKADIIFLDMNNLKSRLEGSVYIKRENQIAKAQKGEIFLKNYNKKLQYFILYDDVKVSEKLVLENGQVLHRRAYAEKLEGIVSENAIILTGFPKVFQGDDVIKGNKIVLRSYNDVVEVDDASTNFKIYK